MTAVAANHHDPAAVTMCESLVFTIQVFLAKKLFLKAWSSEI